MAAWMIMALLGASLGLVVVENYDDDEEDDVTDDPIPETRTGTEEADILLTDGTETLEGLGGNDTLTAGEGSDGAVLNGGAGADELVLSGLNGTANGGEGPDRLSMTGPVDPDTPNLSALDGGEGDDTITATGFGGVINGGGAEDEISIIGVFDGVFGGNGEDTIQSISASYGGGTPLDGGAGNDVLTLAEGAGVNTQSLVDGGAGDDIIDTQMIVGPDGVDIFDILTGGAGTDTFQLSFASVTGTPDSDAALGIVTRITDFDASEDVLVVDPTYLDPAGTTADFSDSFMLQEASDGSHTDVIFSITSNANATTMTGTIRLDGVTGLDESAITFLSQPTAVT